MKKYAFRRCSNKTKCVALILFGTLTVLSVIYKITMTSPYDNGQLDNTFLIQSQRRLPETNNGSRHDKYMFGPAKVPRVPEDYFSSTLNNKYIIFTCDGSGLCGGWADREEGIVAGFLMSQMMGRKFGIRFTVPCDISVYLMPNRENWVVDVTKFGNMRTKHQYVIDHDAWKLREQMVKMDFNAEYPEDVVYFRVNQEFVQYLMKNEQFKSVKWAQGLTAPDIYNTVYRRLFQLAPKLDEQFHEFQNRARKMNRKLICAQIRVWKNPTIPNDFEPEKKLDLNVIWNFLNQYNDSSKYSIFVSTDSEDVRETGQRLYPDCIVDVAGDIVHIERSRGNNVCAGFGKVILDQLVLTTCDVLVLTYSGIGRIASFIRGTSEGMYCTTKGTVEPCSLSDPDYIPYGW